MGRRALDDLDVPEEVGRQDSNQKEPFMRLELEACKSWKVHETILTGRAKKEPPGNQHSCHGLRSSQASCVGGEVTILAGSRLRAAEPPATSSPFHRYEVAKQKAGVGREEPVTGAGRGDWSTVGLSHPLPAQRS